MGHVLKAGQVRLKEPVQLGIQGEIQAESAGTGQSNGRSQVRMTQSDSSGAIIEITCSCGKVIQVRCDYATAVPANP